MAVMPSLLSNHLMLRWRGPGQWPGRGLHLRIYRTVPYEYPYSYNHRGTYNPSQFSSPNLVTLFCRQSTRSVPSTARLCSCAGFGTSTVLEYQLRPRFVQYGSVSSIYSFDGRHSTHSS